MPTVSCGLLPPPPLRAEPSWFTRSVKLTIHDSLGNVSAEATNNAVRLFSPGVCGF
jgi:hypothetical protein